ncbi:MAG: SusC/RagA family TonB-linked outer membrane protein [Gemmatimonadaceae bacterium]|nr:SusC/RagA family TonB-linked outer membrane protein [Gemmatimonadaceae bacterium]
MRTARRACALGIALVSTVMSGVQAQSASGTISGRIRDRSSNAALADVQVQVVGTVRGARSGADGTYRVTNVPAGTYTVRALRLGYTQGVAQVTITAGGSASADFALGATATNLDEVTVSATGEQQRKREIGASISRIDSTSFNAATVTNLSQVLAARTPGIVVQQGAGTSGVGSRIRLRGVTSINLANDPLLVIDGVFANNATASLTFGIGGAQTSRFDDVNPEDIEDIQVIKGPAATALYGTGAANGVIQITTKRGKAGRARWTSYGELGQQRTPLDLSSSDGRLSNDALNLVNVRQIGRNAAGQRVACSREAQVLRTCITPDTLYRNSPFLNESPFRTGGNESYGLSVSGGSQDVQYYFSTDIEQDRGIFAPNLLRRRNLRANLSATLLPTLQTIVNVGYLNSNGALPLNDNLFAGTLSAGLLGGAFDCNPATRAVIAECAVNNDSLSRGYVTSNVPVTQYFAQQQRQNIRRLVLANTLNWTPSTWLKGSLRTGADLLQRDDETLTPPNRVFLNQASVEGQRFQGKSYLPTFSVTGSLTGTFSLTDRVRAITTVGGQYQDTRIQRSDATGAVLLPGTSSLNGANARFAVFEQNQKIVTVAGFMEQRFELNDRLFVTGALRFDDASVFGNSAAGWTYYPSVTASYVMSEERWFPQWSWLNSFRMRAAYGRAGQRPGFRQSETFFTPVSVNVVDQTTNVPAVSIGGPVGNARLAPEITAETEGGFEFSAFNTRLSGELTAFNRDTRDLLVQRTLPPSLGTSGPLAGVNTGTQFVNLSLMRTRGLEGALTIRPIDHARIRFEQNVTFTSFTNRIVDLGSADGQLIAPIPIGGNQFHRAGYPAGAYFQRRILSYADHNGDGIISRVNCPSYGGLANPQLVGGPRCEVVLSDSLDYIGQPLPTRELAFTSNLTLFKSVQLTALVNYRGGNTIYNNTREFRNNGGFANGPDFWDRNAPLAEQVKSTARAMGSSDGYTEDASFVRLSEVAVTYTLPVRWAQRLKAAGASFTVGARNLALWTNYTGFDPEVLTATGANFLTQDFLTNPPVRRVTTRLTLTF